ncbi:MAG: restriction endonuclease [Phycisphaerales bacterium]|nr:restriction endonuclease [Phycisphaerales bacterium]
MSRKKTSKKAERKSKRGDGGLDSSPLPPAPRTPAPRGGRPSALIDTRVIYCGDNLEQLAKLPDACIDLIYIDPPFNSNRNYEVFWGETKEKRSFEDRHASTQAYIDYMRPRCVELARVLKKTGSFYYHCDDHASHYVKVMLDQVFGHQFFQNEIAWKRTGARGDGFAWNQLHDTLFLYSRSAEFTFHRQFEEYGDEYLETKYRYDDGDGRKYRLDNMTSPNPRPNMMYEWKGHASPEKGWRYSKETMAELDADGRVWYPKDKSKRPQLKRYLDEMQGIPMGSVWTDIAPINSQAQERLGYPTQKPLALLERIVSASSNPNDIVLDAFCGCGTALVAAQNLGRQWIGIDISPTACRVMAKRLRDVCKMRESEPGRRAGDKNSFIVRDLPWTVEKLKAIPPFEFENWAVIALGGIPNKVQVGDMGIDGRIFPVGTKPSDAHSMFAGDWFPIQVKQMDKVGRPDIDQFEAVMAREDRQRGFFIAFGFSSDAEAECAAFFKKTKRVIKLITVQEILDEQHVQKM